MLIYFAFYIFPRVSPSPHEHLAKTIPAGSTYGSKLHSVGRAPPENTINHFSLRFKTPGRDGGGGKKSWNFLRKSPSIARSLLLFLLSLRPGMQRATRERERGGRGKGNRHRCAVLQSDIDLTRLCTTRGWKIARVPGNSPTVAGFSSLNLYKVWRILNEFCICSFLSGEWLRIYVDFSHVYTITHTYVHVHIHTIKFVFYYISYVKFLRTVIDRKENQIDLKNQKPRPLDAR